MRITGWLTGGLSATACASLSLPPGSAKLSLNPKLKSIMAYHLLTFGVYLIVN